MEINEGRLIPKQKHKILEKPPTPKMMVSGVSTTLREKHCVRESAEVFEHPVSASPKPRHSLSTNYNFITETKK